MRWFPFWLIFIDILVERQTDNLWKMFGKSTSPESKTSTSVVDFFHYYVCPLELCKMSFLLLALLQNFPFPARAHIALWPILRCQRCLFLSVILRAWSTTLGTFQWIMCGDKKIMIKQGDDWVNASNINRKGVLKIELSLPSQ